MRNEGTLGRLITARIQRVKDSKYEHGMVYTKFSSQSAKDHPLLHYFNARSEPDPFPNPTLFDQINDAQNSEIKMKVKSMI